MVRRTKLMGVTESLIAHKFLTSITGSISDRAKRKYEAQGEEAYKRLKRKEILPKDSGLILKLGWSDEIRNWARNISLALEEFKEINPKAYKQFEKIKEKHKMSRRAYLEFGGEVPDEIYIQVIRDVVGEGKMGEKDLERFYESLRKVSKALKKEEGLYRFLIPE